jgi:hypothetical protein
LVQAEAPDARGVNRYPEENSMADNLTSDQSLCAICGEHANEHVAIGSHDFLKPHITHCTSCGTDYNSLDRHRCPAEHLPSKEPTPSDLVADLRERAALHRQGQVPWLARPLERAADEIEALRKRIAEAVEQVNKL